MTFADQKQTRKQGILFRGFFRLATATLFLGALLCQSEQSSAGNLITMTGSSMLYPLEKDWSSGYEQKNPGTKVDVSSTASGMGYREAYRGNVSIGAADAYQTRNIQKQFPGLVAIPVAMEDVEIVYNLPGVAKQIPLRLDGKTLSRIFLGKILRWDDPMITRQNPAMKLPHRLIRVIHRSDASGTTFVLTDYLTRTSRVWQDDIGRAMAPDWPAGKGVNGSGQLAIAVYNTPWSIGYEGHHWVKKTGLASAALKNHDGFYVRGTVQSIMNAGRSAVKSASTNRTFSESIVFWPPGKNAYPAANFEYWVINPHLDDESMREVRHLIEWVLGPGQSPEFIEKAGFAPMPVHSSGPLLRKILRELIPGSAFKSVSPG